MSTPLMILLGLPASSAIATGKFGGLGISLGASTRFYKEKITDRKTVILFSVFAVIAAVIGAIALNYFRDDSRQLEKIIGWVILLVAIPSMYFRRMGLETTQKSNFAKTIGSFLLFLGVVMQVAVGSGVGSLQMIVLMYFFGMTALTANATRRAVQLVVAIVSLIIFISVGLVDYKYGSVAFISSLAGGLIGAHLAIKKGNRFVINLFAAFSAIMALELIFG